MTLIFVALIAASLLALAAQSGHAPPARSRRARRTRKPLTRRDAFFGLHFDLHPGRDDTVLGADVTEENIAKLLERVRPDLVQYDCKGHPGYTGYPTKIGWPSPGIVKDSLAIWREVTRRYGVGLYIHYSGVWDSVAMEHHPEWARVDADGKPDPDISSTFGPYVGELLIPQLKEVTQAYDLDGAWVDGECWATRLDCSRAALALWQQETGHADAPKDRSDSRWLEWKMFNRRQFERYLCTWVDALHAFRPELQLTSNWMYTTFAPKPVVAKLDWLSGDYTPTLSVDRARVEARYLASTGMPWDLLAWAFNNQPDVNHTLKTPVHLQQEASIVLMHGGGFVLYYTPTRSGHIVDEIIETSGQAADFCRARQAFSHKSTSVPQVALLLSSATQWDRSDAVFAPWGCFDELEGALHALLELHYSVDVLAEHQLQPRLPEFPLVVIPDSYRLEDDFRQALLQYVRDGGSLLLVGEKCARLFESALGVRFAGEPQRTAAELLTADGIMNADGVWQDVTPIAARTLAVRYPDRDGRNERVAATMASLGRGKIGAIYGPVALTHFRHHHPALRRFIGDVVQRLFECPAVTADAPSCVDVSLRRTREGKLSLHLANLANAQRADRFLSTDFVPTVGPIQVRMRVPERPKRVRWAPDRMRLPWTWDDGILSLTIPRLHVHGAVILE